MIKILLTSENCIIDRSVVPGLPLGMGLSMHQELLKLIVDRSSTQEFGSWLFVESHQLHIAAWDEKFWYHVSWRWHSMKIDYAVIDASARKTVIHAVAEWWESIKSPPTPLSKLEIVAAKARSIWPCAESKPWKLITYPRICPCGNKYCKLNS